MLASFQNVPLIFRGNENSFGNVPYNPANDPGIVNLPYTPSTDKSEIVNLPYNPSTDKSQIVPLIKDKEKAIPFLNQFLLEQQKQKGLRAGFDPDYAQEQLIAHHNQTAEQLGNARDQALEEGINPGEFWGGDPVPKYPVPPPPPYFDVPPGHPFYHVRPSGS